MPSRIVVLGTAASSPYGGMAWMHMQIAAGLMRLGHDVHYFETTSAWPYDPVRNARVCDSDYSLPYLERTAREFGLGDRWAYRRSYLDKEWFGMSRTAAEALLAGADAVLNVTGATRLAEEGLEVGRLVYYGTDPVYHEVSYANGDEETRSILAVHGDLVSKNVFVLETDKGPQLVAIDWGTTAGWGIPAPGLAQSVGRSLSPDLATYHGAVHATWSDLRLREVKAMASLGAILRLLAAIDWESESLEHPHLERAMRNLEIFEDRLETCLAESDLAP